MGRRGDAVKGVYSNQQDKPDPDCCVCIHRNGCDRAEEGTFCGKFQSKKPEPRGTDPNKAWEQGEEVEF